MMYPSSPSAFNSSIVNSSHVPRPNDDGEEKHTTTTEDVSPTVITRKRDQPTPRPTPPKPKTQSRLATSFEDLANVEKRLVTCEEDLARNQEVERVLREQLGEQEAKTKAAQMLVNTEKMNWKHYANKTLEYLYADSHDYACFLAHTVEDKAMAEQRNLHPTGVFDAADTPRTVGIMDYIQVKPDTEAAFLPVAVPSVAAAPAPENTETMFWAQQLTSMSPEDQAVMMKYMSPEDQAEVMNYNRKAVRTKTDSTAELAYHRSG